MHVLLTGANGFIGRALTNQLRADGRLDGRAIERLSLLDLQLDGSADGPGVIGLAGDLADSRWLHEALAGPPIDAVFHLASVPGGQAEQDPERAWQVNVKATNILLGAGRAQVSAGAQPPIFVFASSIAVFGAMPGPVTDETPALPTITYGAHKLIGEILVANASRRGWVDGRSLRLPGVLVRPPAPTGQLSAFLSDMIRSLSKGESFVCPMAATCTTWASSLPCVVDQLVRAAQLDGSCLPQHRALTPPTLRFSMSELIEAIGEVRGTTAGARVTFAPNERLEALFGHFPPLEPATARALGLQDDGSLATLVSRALRAAETA